MSANPPNALRYVSNSFQDLGEDKETYNEWYKEVKVLENICDLEIDVITDVLSADFDEIIPSVDGIVYIINPMEGEEFEFFEMTLQIIDTVKRDIPTVLLFYDQSGILPVSLNDILNYIWSHFPQLEAFVNLPPKDFHQIIQCLCLAMILGDTPLNIENAWMRFPIFIELANDSFKQDNYFEAARAIRKAAVIAEIYNKEEYFIYCEQAALLYSRSNQYLEASKIIKRVDERKSKNFKKLYVETMIREGNTLFNKRDFEAAARQYESAAQWSAIELKDKNIIHEAFRLAINSWISACKCKNSFILLERLPHNEVLNILDEISDKIVAAADFLVSTNKLVSAKDQLYMGINTYQKEGLFEILEKFTHKLIEVLIKILEKQVKNKEIYPAKHTYDEIENIWETFEVEKIDLDAILEKLIRMLIKELNFGMVSLLINKLNSLDIKKELTELSSDTEDKIKEERKKNFERNIQDGLKILNEFSNDEQTLVIEINKKTIEDANKLVKRKKYLEGASKIKSQVTFLLSLGKDEIANQVLTKSLDILLKAKLFENFFEFYNGLSKKRKKSYLKQVFPIYIDRLKEMMEEESYEKNEPIFERSNRIYRNQMLYEESKGISEQFIKAIKNEALRIVQTEDNINGINKASELVKKVKDISSSYLENVHVTFNKLFKKIAEIYISLHDLLHAQAYSDRIENKAFQTMISKKIIKIEASKSAIKSKQAEESLKGEILKEKLGIIKKKARDAFHDKAIELRQRRGFRRAYYNVALNFLKKNQYDDAIKTYKASILQFNKIKKYNLAGVSLAISSFLLMKQKKMGDMVKLVDEIKKELSGSGKLFSETFSVILLEYILAIKKLNDEPKLKEALSFLENLPLFDEELNVLYEFLGKEIKKEEEVKVEKPTITPGEIANKRSEINKIARSLEFPKQDIARRKMMKRQYWNKALMNLSNNDALSASLVYLDAVPKLMDKKFFRHAAIGLMLGSIILIKEKGIETAKAAFEKNIKGVHHFKEDMEKLTEIKIMRHLLFAFENNVKALIELCIEHLTGKLYLFDQEVALLKSFTEKVEIKEEKKVSITREARGELSKLKIALSQTLSNLQQQMRDVRSESKDFLTKRKAMKRRYYDEIIGMLKNKSFEEAAIKYMVIAKTISRRKDFKTSALLLLLHGLSIIKSGGTPDKAKASINKFLDSLGLSKRLIVDSFYLTLLLFIIDVKINDMKEFNSKINQILEVLPLFEEEKDLIKLR